MTSKHTITIEDGPHRFQPQDLPIVQGDTVEWISNSTSPHTVTPEAGEFPEKNPIGPGETHSVVIGRPPGKINYFCEFHPMAGTISVSQAAGSTKERATEFWFAFDNAFLFQPAPEILQAYSQMGGPDAFRRLFITTRANGTYPAAFAQQAQAVSVGLLKLADAQLAVMDAHFPNEPDSLRQAFEDFGQGVLFDDRRNVGDKIHKMDVGGPDIPPIGYHRWHGFIRAAVAAGADQGRWLHIDRCVGLAWQIQALARPREDDPANPGLPEAQRAGLRARWMAMLADELDTEFDSSPLPRAEPLVAGAPGRPGARPA